MLKKLTHIIPGIIEVWLMLATIYIDIDNQKDAETVLRHVLNNLDPSNSDAHLKLAQILIRKVL